MGAWSQAGVYMKKLVACAAGPVRFPNGVTVSTRRGTVQLLPHEEYGRGESAQGIAGALHCLGNAVRFQCRWSCGEGHRR